MRFAPRAVLVIGVQAAGKSTVGRALAARCERAAFIEGDLLWKMVVGGAADMSGEPDGEALAQLALRYRHGAMLCESFVGHGFVAVHAENLFGDDVPRQLAAMTCPASLVVLRPRPDVVAERELGRGTDAYAPWTPPGGTLSDAIAEFDRWLDATPRIGLWLDTSGQGVDDTVDEILSRWDEAIVT